MNIYKLKNIDICLSYSMFLAQFIEVVMQLFVKTFTGKIITLDVECYDICIVEITK